MCSKKDDMAIMGRVEWRVISIDECVIGMSLKSMTIILSKLS